MTEGVKKQDYASIYNYLKNHGNAVNYQDMDFGPAFLMLTGLGWALYLDDWEMAAIFFINGAGPDFNI